MTMLLNALLLVSATASVSLNLNAPSKDLLVAEPLKLVLRWRAPREIDVRLDNQNHGFRYLQFWIDDGSGPKRYCEASRAPSESLTARVLPKNQDEVVQNVVLVQGSYGENCTIAGNTFPFSRAGRYSLKAVYSDGRLRAESNSLSFDVKEPTGKEREVLERVVKDPSILLEGSRRERLFEKYVDSPYLRFAQIRALDEREIKLRGHQNPDTGESLWHLDMDDYNAFCVRYHKRMAEELLAASDWGPFEEERLQLAVSHSEQGDDQNAAERLKAEIMERFPRSQALQEIKARESDGDEPAVKPKQ